MPARLSQIKFHKQFPCANMHNRSVDLIIIVIVVGESFAQIFMIQTAIMPSAELAISHHINFERLTFSSRKRYNNDDEHVIFPPAQNCCAHCRLLFRSSTIQSDNKLSTSPPALPRMHYLWRNINSPFQCHCSVCFHIKKGFRSNFPPFDIAKQFPR